MQNGIYYEKRIKELQEEINSLELDKYKLSVTEEEAEESLDFHLKQLEKLGATLEDSICEILRKIIGQQRLQKQIDKKQEELKSLRLDLDLRGY